MKSNKWKGSKRSSRLPSNWSSLKKIIFKRDNYICQLSQLGCLVRATEVDHIQPGDNHNLENLQAVCNSCHKKKSSAEGHKAQAAIRAARYRKKPTHPGRRVR